MLASPHRLRHRRDFLAARDGRRVGSATLVVELAEPAPGAGAVRVGFVVGRGCGPAVARNRLRRRLRHLMAAELPSLPAGAVIVVRARPAAAAVSGGRLRRDLAGLLRRVLA